MVKFVGFDHLAAFIDVCWLLLCRFAGFYSSLVAANIVHCDRLVQCCDFIFTSTQSKKVAKQLVGSCRERDKTLEQADDAAIVLHCHIVINGSYLSLQEFQGCIVVLSSL